MAYIKFLGPGANGWPNEWPYTEFEVGGVYEGQWITSKKRPKFYKTTFTFGRWEVVDKESFDNYTQSKAPPNDTTTGDSGGTEDPFSIPDDVGDSGVLIDANKGSTGTVDGMVPVDDSSGTGIETGSGGSTGSGSSATSPESNTGSSEGSSGGSGSSGDTSSSGGGSSSGSSSGDSSSSGETSRTESSGSGGSTNVSVSLNTAGIEQQLGNIAGQIADGWNEFVNDNSESLATGVEAVSSLAWLALSFLPAGRIAKIAGALGLGGDILAEILDASKIQEEENEQTKTEIPSELMDLLKQLLAEQVKTNELLQDSVTKTDRLLKYHEVRSEI